MFLETPICLQTDLDSSMAARGVRARGRGAVGSRGRGGRGFGRHGAHPPAHHRSLCGHRCRAVVRHHPGC